MALPVMCRPSPPPAARLRLRRGRGSGVASRGRRRGVSVRWRIVVPTAIIIVRRIRGVAVAAAVGTLGLAVVGWDQLNEPLPPTSEE